MQRLGKGTVEYSLLTTLMITDVGVLTLNEKPNCLAPLTNAPSSEKRQRYLIVYSGSDCNQTWAEQKILLSNCTGQACLLFAWQNE